MAEPAYSEYVTFTDWASPVFHHCYGQDDTVDPRTGRRPRIHMILRRSIVAVEELTSGNVLIRFGSGSNQGGGIILHHLDIFAVKELLEPPQ